MSEPCKVCKEPIYNLYCKNVTWNEDFKTRVKMGLIISTSYCVTSKEVDPYLILEKRFGIRPAYIEYEFNERAFLCMQCKTPYHYDCTPGTCTNCGSYARFNCTSCAPGYCPGECQVITNLLMTVTVIVIIQLVVVYIGRMTDDQKTTSEAKASQNP